MALILKKTDLKNSEGIELPEEIFIRIKPEHEWTGSQMSFQFKYFLSKEIEGNYSEIKGISWQVMEDVQQYDEEGYPTETMVMSVRKTAPLKIPVTLTPEFTQGLTNAVQTYIQEISQTETGQQLITNYSQFGLVIQVVYHILAKHILETRFGSDSITIRLDLI